MCQCPSFLFGTVDEVLHCIHCSQYLPVSQVPRLGSEVSRGSTGNSGAITDPVVTDKGFMLPTAEIKYTCSVHTVSNSGFKVLSENNKCTYTSKYKSNLILCRAWEMFKSISNQI